MEKTPYTNTGKTTVYVGGVMVPPGDTREVDQTLLPGFTPGENTTASSVEPTHIVNVLMQKSAREILAAIPTLALEDLEKLGEREQQGAARKEILAAVAERLLTQASTDVDQSMTNASRGQNQTQPLTKPQDQEPVNGEQPNGQQQNPDPSTGHENDAAGQADAAAQTQAAE